MVGWCSCSKGGERKVKRHKMKQAVSVGDSSMKNLEAEDGNLVIQTQTSGLEETAGGQEGEMLLESSPDRAGDNVVAGDKRIDPVKNESAVVLDTPEDKKVKRKRKRSKVKQAVSAVTMPEKNPETEGENFACQTELATGNQSSGGAEMHDIVQEGASLLIISPGKPDGNIVSVTGICSNELIDGANVGKKRKKKRVQNVSSVSSTSCEAQFPLKCSPAENAVIENQKHDIPVLPNMVSGGNENLETAVAETTSLLSAGSPMMETNGSIKNVEPNVIQKGENGMSQMPERTSLISKNGTHTEIISDDTLLASTQTSEGHICKKRKNKKNKKPTTSHTGALKEAVILENETPEASSMRDTGIAISVEGNMSLTDESTDMVIDNVSGSKTELRTDIENRDGQGLKGMTSGIGIVKQPQDTAPDQVVTASVVSFPGTEIPNSGKEKKKTKKCPASTVPQLDQSDKDGTKDANTVSSIVIDTETKQSREGNNLVLTERIPITTLLSPKSIKDIHGPVSNGEAIHEKILLPPPDRIYSRPPSRKLLILDINGLLADIAAGVPSGYKPDTMVSQKAVFKRPFCEDFLRFCFEKFDVGVWSSRVKRNVDRVLDFLMGDMKYKLVFYWDRSHCTITGFPTVENRDKPLVLKELRKLWDDHQFHLGKYEQSNTLLLDDSPYKALCNPADTAIFPVSYQYTDVNDCSLGPGGDLRVYLEKLAMADNIPEYVRSNRFGQRPIRETNLSWKYYKKVLDSRSSRPNR